MSNNNPYPFDVTSNMPDQIIGSSHPDHRFPDSFDSGVWFQSSTSGLWYKVKNAAGDISAVRVDGVIHQVRQQNIKPIDNPADTDDK